MSSSHRRGTEVWNSSGKGHNARHSGQEGDELRESIVRWAARRPCTVLSLLRAEEMCAGTVAADKSAVVGMYRIGWFFC
jgi:hypothetical protein